MKNKTQLCFKYSWIHSLVSKHTSLFLKVFLFTYFGLFSQVNGYQLTVKKKHLKETVTKQDHIGYLFSQINL